MENITYAVEDSFYQQNRIFTIDVSDSPAKLIAETKITDTNDVFAGISTIALAGTSVTNDDPSRADVFDEVDLSLLINEDKTVNIDPEGISKASDGGFWIASEERKGDATLICPHFCGLPCGRYCNTFQIKV